MSDNDEGPLFDSADTSPPSNEADPELVDDTHKVSLDDESEKKPDSEVGLPASIPVSIESDPAPEPQKKTTEEQEEEDDQFDSSEIEIKVSNPEKVGDGMSAYMVYRVSTRTSFPTFKSPESNVKRRFSDFLGLHERLVEKHLPFGRIVPVAPEKSVVGMTKVKMSKGEDGGPEAFIDRRKAALERYLNRTARHPKLREDPDFKEFLEAESLPKATQTSALSKGGLSRFVKNVGTAVSKMTKKATESDHWFEEKHNQIETMEQQLKKLHAAFETLVNLKKDVVSNTVQFSKSISLLSSAEEHTGLSRALSHLAELEEKMEQLHHEQSNVDFFLLCESLKEYLGLIHSVKETFNQRIKVYNAWQSAQATLTKKRETLVKLELAGKQEKVPAAQEEVKDWEKKVEKGQEEFDDISKTIQKEFSRFEKNRVMDFKELIVKYLESLMDVQQKMIKYWESYLPEAKSIA
eukprot:gene9657-10645_t